MKRTLKLFNTESRKKEPLIPADGKCIRLYTCGPTVYDYAHIGNFRTYVFEDLLRRTLEYFSWEVEQVMNITDVDDKTIRGATAKGSTLSEYTEPYKQAFFEDIESLGIQPASHYPEATAFIPQMIGMIEELMDKKVAYVGGDKSVYYSIAAFPGYGRLSHLNLSELKTGVSQSSDEYDKDMASDFVLWKAYDQERDGEIFWESPFGPGRPGWHLECSCMAMEILGTTLDLHMGGVDNIFPHHENEIAQSEACSGTCFSRMWAHSEHLIVDGKKMSKSLGNFYTFRDLASKGYSGPEVRYVLLSTHYRTQANFTFQGLDAARSSLARIQAFIQRLREPVSGDRDYQEVTSAAEEAFSSALEDDLNISQALAALFDLVHKINAAMDVGDLSPTGQSRIFDLLQSWNGVLNVMNFQEEEIPSHLQTLLEKRDQARREKNWQLADELRMEIDQAGYGIEDGKAGGRLIKKER